MVTNIVHDQYLLHASHQDAHDTIRPCRLCILLLSYNPPLANPSIDYSAIVQFNRNEDPPVVPFTSVHDRFIVPLKLVAGLLLSTATFSLLCMGV